MQKLIEGLHKFREEMVDVHGGLFERLSQGQNPEALFITCSDSRINPNLITHTQPGDLFILRNAGNIVPAYSGGASGEASTIEFAVEGLGVRNIILCGHTLCGAMKGLLNLEGLDGLPATRRWLDHAESTRRLVKKHYAHLDEAAMLSATVEENVLVQIENLRTHPAVRSGLASGEISIYAWVYKLQTGEVFQYDPKEGQYSLLERATPVEPTTRAVPRNVI